jgi:hypothetical protein
MKKLIDIVAGDADRQCKKDPQCHRFDGHADACKTFGRVLAEKAELFPSQAMAIARAWARRARGDEK